MQEGTTLTDWLDRLNVEVERAEQERQRYTHLFPLVAQREFDNLYWLLADAANMLNAKLEQKHGRVSISRVDEGVVEVSKDDACCKVVLSADSKQINVDHGGAPIVYRLDLSNRNDLLVYRDGRMVNFEVVAEAVFVPLYGRR